MPITRRIRGFHLWAFVPILVGLPFVIHGSLAVNYNSTGLIDWLPDRQPERKQYEWFAQQFGSDDFICVAWPGCTLRDPRLAALESGLLRQAGPGAADAKQRLVSRVLTGPNTIDWLTSPPLSLTRDQAIACLRGLLVGTDGMTSAAVVELAPTGRQNRRAAIDEIIRAAHDSAGLDRSALRMCGSALEAAAMDLEARRNVHQNFVPIAALTLLLLWLCFRSLRLLVIVGLMAAYCRFMSMALIHDSGSGLSIVLAVTVALVYVLTVSGAVHLANYHAQAARSGGVPAATAALRIGWLPCTLAMLTTVIGLLSLLVSQIEPIRSFGIYSSVGLVVAFLLTLPAIPAALDLWRPAVSKSTGSWELDRAGTDRRRIADRASSFMIRHRRAIVAGSLCVIAASALGLARMQVSVRIERMFAPDSEVLRGIAWMEERIGPVVPVEIVVRMPLKSSLGLVERVQLVGRIERAVGGIDGVGGTFSAAAVLPAFRDIEQAGVLRRAVTINRLRDSRAQLIDQRLLAETADEELWRITARVPAIGSDYGRFMREAKERTEGVLKSSRLEKSAPISAVYTGLLPIVESAQHQLLWDLIASMVLTTLMLSPIMMLAAHGVWAGLLAMIPSVAPLVLVFGCMGWLGFAIDVGSVLTASLTLGIATDNALHTLAWFNFGIRDGLSPREAIAHAYRGCSKAIVNTTVICAVGLLPLVYSDFLPTRRFAVLTALLLFAALAGDLVLFPAMLAGPLGRFFVLRRRSPKPRLASVAQRV